MTKETKKLVAEKLRQSNDYKLTQGADSFASIKKYRNLVNRKLEKINIQRNYKIESLKRKME